MVDQLAVADLALGPPLARLSNRIVDVVGGELDRMSGGHSQLSAGEAMNGQAGTAPGTGDDLAANLPNVYIFTDTTK